jgi:hypothetical protein
VSGLLVAEQSLVVRQLLVDIGQAANPSYDASGNYNGGAWPAFSPTEPSSPDECITVQDTPGRLLAASQVDGEWAEYFGVQIRLRSLVEADGKAKLNAIVNALDKTVLRQVVTVGGNSCCVHNLIRRGSVLPLGFQRGTKRSLFTVNYEVDLYEL